MNRDSGSKMRLASLTLFTTLMVVLTSTGSTFIAAAAEGNVPDIDPEFQKVTCRSSVKLTHSSTQYKLHSHNIQYGTGSGQQSVTGMDAKDDVNSLWQVLGDMNKECERGDPIECSQTIRLRHVQTKHYLHSHDDHRSPLSRFQEISAFQGSDDGDHWVVECLLDRDNNDNDKAKDKGMGYWRREAPIKLRHKNTGLFMGARKEHVFQHPIPGQLEVAGYHGGNKHVSDEFLIWAAQEGVYFAETLKK